MLKDFTDYSEVCIWGQRSHETVNCFAHKSKVLIKVGQ